MAVTEARGVGTDTNRFKAAGPAAAAIGIITSIIGVSLLASAPESPPEQMPSALPPAVSSTPSPAPSAEPTPGLASPQFNQGAGGSTQMGMEIVVKFKDDAKVKDIIDAFWKDQGSAKSKFEAWKGSHPEFAKLKLDRVTYSNELVLVHDGSAPAADRLPAMKAIAAKLGTASDISYAEPNMTAQPGVQ